MVLGDPERLRVAAARFVAFFHELDGIFVERDDVLTQIALALLSREHVLMTGPPGTAKSRLATASLGRIVDDETRQPSLFARQFTESTVQTDLVGPIDFKTLIDTGRTEHFTDEGMLGAVHAFLDEVFDGRDMLLRSALNVLHERELKQGTKTTAGRIECAVMTSNRYLSEVLEGSRESLLAFVDRIAFVSFVPRGFSSTAGLGAVLRTQVVGNRAPPLGSLLTLQDLDVLQAATERVWVAEEVCELLVTLLASFEAEIAAAVRADPTFVPTRYLSTRTAVRLGNLLRAIAVYDWAFGDRSRPFSVTRKDFASLRLSLVSAGPSPEQIKTMLELESDPRERRQLSTLRTEREIFERCLAKLPRGAEVFPGPPKPAARAVGAESPAQVTPRDLRSQSIEDLLETVRELGAIAELGDPRGERAGVQLSDALSMLAQRLMLGGIDPAGSDAVPPRRAIERLASIADRLEESGADRRPIADWLRGQALRLLHDCVLLGFPAAGSSLEAALAEDVDAMASGKQLIEELAELAALERALSAGRRDQSERGRAEAGWLRALERLEHELVALWSEDVRQFVARALAETPDDDLAGVVSALGSSLGRMSAAERELDAVGGSGARLRRRVIGPQLTPFVRTAFERFDTSERARVVQQVEASLDTLRGAGLSHTISSAELLTWTAEALLRADGQPETTAEALDYDGYRALRVSEQRMSLAYTLAELCLGLTAESELRSMTPAELLVLVRDRLAELPGLLKTAVIARDLKRIERPIAFLEQWWAELDAAATSNPDADQALRALVRSRFFHLTRDEAALARFALEIRLVADAFPNAEVTPLQRRIAELDAKTLARVEELLERRSSVRWQKLDAR